MNTRTESLPCPLCHSSHSTFFLQAKDRFGEETFAIQQCTQCHAVYTKNPPSLIEINKYYDHPNYIPHVTGVGILSSIVRFVRIFRIRKRCKLLTSQKATLRRLLDIGCGTGELLAAMQKKNWSAIGVETDRNAATYCTEKHGVPIVPWTKLQNEPDGSFDRIVLWHALEHLHDPMNTIKTIKRLLSSDGRCIVAMPNYQSLQAHQYGNTWVGYDVPRHIVHFMPETFMQLLQQHELEVWAVQPLHLDTCIFALLSEPSALWWPRGIARAFQQLLYSLCHPSQSPSMMYIIRHG